MANNSVEINELIFGLCDLDVSKFDESFVKTSLQKRLSTIGCTTVDEYYTLIEKETSEGVNFYNSLQISYSEFFRNPLTFAVLECIVLPLLLRKKQNSTQKEIRIWSSACATGQEPYSLAMLLNELMAIGTKNAKYRIFATDQSPQQIEQAKKGTYFDAALNNLTTGRAIKWFSKEGNINCVNALLKENIDFSVFDLLSNTKKCPPSSIFGNFDLIICSNVLFYYKFEQQQVILDKVKSSLATDGIIMVGEAERDILIKLGFKEIYPQSALFVNG